jgi:hypothetical protein
MLDLPDVVLELESDDAVDDAIEDIKDIDEGWD